jgi:hypothetical protein
VLLLAGGLDVFQPDSLVLSQWLGPHSQLVAVSGALHGVRGAAPCLRKMVGDFIRAPERLSSGRTSHERVSAISPCRTTQIPTSHIEARLEVAVSKSIAMKFISDLSVII